MCFKDEDYRGGKSGHISEAGKTNVGIFRIPVGEEERSVVIVVLNSKDTKSDTDRLQKEVIENIIYESN